MNTFSLSASRAIAVTFVLALTPALGSSAPAFAAGARTDIVVDCLVTNPYRDDHALVPGDILTVVVVNCLNWTIRDLDHVSPGNTDIPGGSIVVGTNGTQSFLVSGAANLDFDPPLDSDGNPIGSVADIDIDVYVANQATVPPGALVDTRLWTMTRQDVDDFEIGTVSDRGNYWDLGGDIDCSLEAGFHTYVTQSFTAATSGDFTFRNISIGPTDEDIEWGKPRYPNDDFFLALYTSFDPDDPEANLVACNDDRAEEFDDDWYRYVSNSGSTYIFDWRAPELVASLSAGTYDLVLTTHTSISDTDWFNGEHSTWSRYSDQNWEWRPVVGAPLIELTALMEIWYLEGAASAPSVAGAPGAGATAVPTLAATGPQAPATVGGVVISGVLVALGIALGGASRIRQTGLSKSTFSRWK